MQPPILRKDYSAPVAISPRQHWALEQHRFADIVFPQAVLLCFEPALLNRVAAEEARAPLPFWNSDLLPLAGAKGHPPLALVRSWGIGGPAFGNLVEILVAGGTTHFIMLGNAGGLQPTYPKGTTILCTKAVRDEGTSYHYLPPSEYAFPSESLNHLVGEAFAQDQRSLPQAPSWTVDSMYRETPAQIAYYQYQGVATVESELASLFAIAKYRAVAFSGLVVISDVVSQAEWDEGIHAVEVGQALYEAYGSAKKALTRAVCLAQ